MAHGMRYTKEEKEEILRFRKTHTFQETSAKYGVSMMTLFRWSKHYKDSTNVIFKSYDDKARAVLIRSPSGIQDPTKPMHIVKVLEVLKFIEGVKAIALFNEEGQSIALLARDDINEDGLFMASISLYGTSQTASKQLGQGNVDMVISRSAAGMHLVMGAGEDRILSVLFGESGDFKHLIAEDLAVIERVRQALSEPNP